MKISDLHALFLEQRSMSTDSRNIAENCIYFSLKGDNFNGNEFANEALEKGASYVVVDEKINKNFPNHHYIEVNDVLTVLQELATYHRDYLGIPIIALTGSNGKTTTKELINCVLKTKYNIIATIGNLNNHIGVPLTLLSMTDETEIGIVEMGANHKKEIQFLCEIAKPNFGYITNFGKAHLEGFGGIEGVIIGKSEMYDYLIKNNGFVFFNEDDDIQNQKIKNYKYSLSFTSKDSQGVQLTLKESKPYVSVNYKDVNIKSNLIGSYNFTNICAAVCIGIHFNVDAASIKNAIENYTPNNNRSQIIKSKGLHIILDAYNANPTSMNAALDNFNQLENDYKVIILGDMFELGSKASKEHQKIVDKTLNLNVDEIFLVGENFYQTNSESNRITKFKKFQELEDVIKQTAIKSDSCILIKGSRGMALERLLKSL